MDIVKAVLVLGSAALTLSVLCAGYLAFTNSESRNLALAFSALVGGTTAFVVQTYFELRHSKEERIVTTEITIDRAEKRVWRFMYDRTAAHAIRRQVADDRAGIWLAANSPIAFQVDNTARLSRDVVLFEVASLLCDPSTDWKFRPVVYSGGANITLINWQADDKVAATDFEAARWEELLRKAGSLVPLQPDAMSRTQNLPPETDLSVAGDGRVYVRNPFMSLVIRVDVAPIVLFVNPATREPENLPTGEPRFETRQVNVIFSVTYSALRSQSKGLKMYKDWFAKLVDASRVWFAPQPNGPQ
jgi:hypothetical protein